MADKPVARFNHVMPVLKVRDMQAAIDFYTAILGFKLCWQTAGEDGEICRLEAGNASLMLFDRRPPASNAAHDGNTLFQCE